MAMRPGPSSDEQDYSRSSSSATSPAPPDNEESDLGAKDSQSSLGVPNFQDMHVGDACWPPVNRLPNEILISVFKRLSAPSDHYHCMLVSKRWARNAVDLLWLRPACTTWNKHTAICRTLGIERSFFSYRDFVKRLNLAALAEKISDGLINLVEDSPSLQALDISNDTSITEQSIHAIAQHCRRLQGLNISGCEGVSNESMILLAQSCKFIKRLKLNECTQLRDDAVHAFADHCPKILEIDLHQCQQIGNGPVTALLTKGNCLRELRLANCDLIDDQAFMSLPHNHLSEHLRILDLTSCINLTDAAVAKIVDVAPRLRNLVLAKCRNITDAAVGSIARLGKNLHYVHLGHCGQITDEGVKKLVNSCNRIRYIDLGCCTHLTDESVRRLALLPKLKRIGLVKCSSITDESVFALAEAAFRPRVRRDASGMFFGGEYYASSLERVHLSYCVNLTLKVSKPLQIDHAAVSIGFSLTSWESIMRLLNSCPRLTHLSLTGVAAFQREEFQAFFRVAPAEFTQHQRDVFCVFSGNSVSDFRDFLNTSPRFQELRESLPYRAGGSRIRGAATRRSQVAASNLSPIEGEGLDEDMGDEEQDFEALDGNEMAVDAYSPQQQAPAGISQGSPSTQAANASHVMMVSAPHSISQSLPLPNHGLSTAQHHNIFGPAAGLMGPLAIGPLGFSSFMDSGPASAGSPHSVYGYTQASLANLAFHPSSSRPASSTRPGGSATGASTALMQLSHQDSVNE